MVPAYTRLRSRTSYQPRYRVQRRRRLVRVQPVVSGLVVARPQHFYVNDDDVILPDTSNVATGSWVLVGRINQSGTVTVTLENDTVDEFIGVGVGVAASTPIELTTAGQVVQFVANPTNQQWIVISDDQ